MSNENAKQSNGVNSVSSISSVEIIIDDLLAAGLPIKSMVVVHDVVAGVILGEVDEVDHEHELAAGVTYLVIGLGKVPTDHQQGITHLNLPKGK